MLCQNCKAEQGGSSEPSGSAPQIDDGEDGKICKNLSEPLGGFGDGGLPFVDSFVVGVGNPLRMANVGHHG